jgi:hypothetical protein
MLSTYAYLLISSLAKKSPRLTKEEIYNCMTRTDDKRKKQYENKY